MADIDDNELHIESVGTQWEVSKKNISGTDYGIAEEDTMHHNWQELSLQKNIRNLDEARVFLENDKKNSGDWANQNYIDVVSSRNSNFVNESFDFVDNNSEEFENPISSFGLIKILSNYDATTNELKSEKNNISDKKYNYEDYLSKYERSADKYKNIEKKLGTYPTEADVKIIANKYKEYGNIDVKRTDRGYELYLPPETQAAIYNKTEAVALAKFDAAKAQQADKTKLGNINKLIAENKQKAATRVAVFKQEANKNDNIRKLKKQIEEAKSQEEQEKNKLNDDKQADINSAIKDNVNAADKYQAEMSKAGTPISDEEKADYLKALNDKSIAKITSQYDKKLKKVTDRTGTLTARAEAAIATESTSDLFSSLEAENAAKKTNFLSKLSGLAGTLSGLYNSAMGLYGKAKDILNGKLDLSKLNLDVLSKTGLANNKFLNKMFSQLGLKENLFDNMVSDLYKTSAAYAKDMINSAIKLGFKSVMDKCGLSVVDDIMLSIVKPLVLSGGDPNYNGTFLKYILLADCPHCLAYLDDYNGISDYLLNSQGKEYLRGETAAKNGCHKVALYVAKKLYAQYRINNNGTPTADVEKATKYADEIKKIFKSTVVYSYNSFDVNNLKVWFREFNDILKPCILGTNDIFDSGKYKISNNDINTIAKIVEVSEFSKDNLSGSISFSSKTGMDINGKETGGKFGKANISETKKYIDVRNKNIKKIYMYLVYCGNGYTSTERLTHKDLHDRLSYPGLSSLAKTNSNLINNIANTSTFGNISDLLNNSVKASVHKTLALMANNNLIPFTSDNVGNGFKDETGSIPEFVDNSTSVIKFFNGIDSDNVQTQTINNGKNTRLNKNLFIKPGYRFLGWSRSIESANVDYQDCETISTNSNLSLYAVWEIDPNYDPNEPSTNVSTGISNSVVNNVTEEDVSKKINDIMLSIQTPDIFSKYGFTSFKNFKCVDLSNFETNDDRDFKYIKDRTINSYSDNDKSYSVEHYTKLYTNDIEKYNDISNDNDKELCYYYALCYNIVQKYARTLSYTSIETIFGSSTLSVSYKIDENDNYILDMYGNKIIENEKYINTPDSKFAECLSIFKDACMKIREYCLSIYNKTVCSVEFDLCGLSNDHISSFKVKAYESIKDYKPIDPVANGYIFKGWSIDPNGYNIIDWETDIIFKNTILFAVWEKTECYIKDFTLRKDKNDSLIDDVVATIDHQNGTIKLHIHSSEMDEHNRYYIHVDIPKGCTIENIDFKRKQLVSPTSSLELTVIDSFENSKYYNVELIEIEDDNKTRISYVTDNAVISNNAIFSQDKNTALSTLPVAEKSGYIFKGWSLNNSSIPINNNILIDGNSVVFHAIFEEVEYSVSYMNANEEAFDGKHNNPYVTTIKYSEGKILDKPTKEDYVFNGYFKDRNCTDKINALYKYNCTSDTVLYADWIDRNEYDALYGTLIINNNEISLSKTMFYTSMIMLNNERWVISGTGLNVFSINGEKIKSFNKMIGGKQYIPIGIAVIGSENTSTILVIVRHTFKNKTFLYYTSDRGMSWNLVLECTRLNLNLSDTTGTETVNYLTFYQTIIYNGHIYSIFNKNGDWSIIIDGNENIVILSSLNSKYDITANKRILGMCATVDKKLYVLFENVGVIMYTNFEPTINDNEYVLNLNLSGLGVSGWLDNYYNLDTDNIGNPYNAININMNLDDDFDINDPSMIDTLKSYYTDNKIYVLSYLKVENDEYPISDIIWDWTDEVASGIILSEKSWVIANMNNLKPSLLKPRNKIKLDVRSKLINREHESTLDVSDVREIPMSKENCLNYLGWTRVISNFSGEITETHKITLDYLNETGMLSSLNSETWRIYFNKSELIVTEVEGKRLIMYDAPEIIESDEFLKYLKDKTPNISNIRQIDISKENCSTYLGWTRVVLDSSGKVSGIFKITTDYLVESGVNISSEIKKWYVYPNEEIVSSNSNSSAFLNYLKTGKIPEQPR